MVNPWNIKEIEESIKTALTMNEPQKISDHSHLLSYVRKFTSIHWGQTFVTDLLATCNFDVDSIKIPTLILNNISEILGSSKSVIKYFSDLS